MRRLNTLECKIILSLSVLPYVIRSCNEYIMLSRKLICILSILKKQSRLFSFFICCRNDVSKGFLSLFVFAAPSSHVYVSICSYRPLCGMCSCLQCVIVMFNEFIKHLVAMCSSNIIHSSELCFIFKIQKWGAITLIAIIQKSLGTEWPGRV